MKSWERYAIHIIEPVLHIIGNQGKIKNIKNTGEGDKHIVTVTWEKGLQVNFTTLGYIPSPISIRVFGKNGFKELIFKDPFSAFKNALKTFINVILKKEQPVPKDFVLDIIKIIEGGIKNV